MSPRLPLPLIALVVGLAASIASAAAAAPVTVFAAASLKNALDAVITQWDRSGGNARASYGASSALARQLQAVAPADIFISADSAWMDWAGQRHLIVPASRRTLLSGRLVLIAPKASKTRLAIGPGMALAAALGGGRLAVAAPEVPAGRYARAALTSLGVWRSVQGRLAPAQDVRVALSFVALGEAPLGIVYQTDAMIEPGVRIVGFFPPWSYPKIVYPVAIVAGSRNPADRAFLAFVEGPRAAAIFRRFGFVVPG